MSGARLGLFVKANKFYRTTISMSSLGRHQSFMGYFCFISPSDIWTYLKCVFSLSTFQINNPASAILDEEGRLTLHLEWLDSTLLFNDMYNKIDEIDSRHKHQMA